MEDSTDWKLYSLLDESAATVELHLGTPENTESFDASTGAAHHYIKKYFYYEKGIVLEFLTLFGKVFRPSPSQVIPRLRKIILQSKYKEKPNLKLYANEILKGIYLEKKIEKEDIEKGSNLFLEKGIQSTFILNENSELEKVVLEFIPEKSKLLWQLKLEQKTAINPKYKIENEWKSQGHSWEVSGLFYFKEKDILVSISQDTYCKYWSFDSSNSIVTYQYGGKWKPGFSALSNTNSDKEILIGNRAGELLHWNLETLKIKQYSITSKKEDIKKIVFLDEDRVFVSVLKDYLYCYSLSEEKSLYKLKGKLAFDHFPFAVHRGKKELINGNSGHIHNLDDGNKVGTIFDFIGHKYDIKEVEFSQNEKYLFIAYDNSFTIVDYETKTKVYEEKLKTSGGLENIWKAMFVLEDKYLIIASFGVLKVLEVESWKTIVDILDFEFSTKSLCFIESKKLILIGSSEGRIIAFDLETGIKQKIWGGHKELVYSVAAYNEKSLFLSGDGAGYIYYWEKNTKNLAYFNKIHNSTITTMEVLPNGNILTGSWDKTIKVSDSSGRILWEMDGKDWIYNAFWVQSKNSILFSNKLGLIKLVDWNKNTIYEVQVEQTGPYPSDFDLLAYSNVNEEFAFLNKKEIFIHDVHTGKEKIKLETKESMTRICFSPNGSVLFLSDYSGNIYCLDRYSGEILKILRGHTDRISHFSFFEEWMASTGREEKLFLWNWQTLEFLGTQNHTSGGISPVVILDKSQILCGAKSANLNLKRVTLNEK